ncbi:MFS transporter [Azorhizobium oxalatiphilum]|uniref:MFS transporter n=1 Tax=Azorhizobium oxalatiphilum TaxID=980631 RepID=A0A917CA41_9HYPH|nr:MFS transporter [Azorhizobium oxalatiphilum]GGF81277.1 MFS transporter [Azorhizobium oxalatiphilum]
MYAVSPPPEPLSTRPPASRRAVIGWVLFDPACQPFFSVVTTFIFGPYFVSAVMHDPAQGQAAWGFATGLAGLVIALASPVLGAIADAGGRRKPWIAVCGVMLTLGSAALWFALPGDESRAPLILAAFALATIGAECAVTFNNAMMPGLVPPERLGRLSGLGWAAGYAGGLIALALVLALFATNAETGLTLLGHPPAFGLDAALREGDRIAGPLSALWFVVLVLPMFLFTPDRPRGLPLAAAVRSGVKDIARLFARLKGEPNLARFLLANMVYNDGLVGLFALGGIYAAGTFGWGSVEIGTFGILLLISGIFGALAGGFLDDVIGGRRVVLLCLGALTFAALGILSLSKDALLFGLVPTAPGSGLFGTAPEKAYLGLGLIIGLVAGPLQAASRTLLARLAPPEHLTEYFGLFSLSGRLTSFAAPMLVALVTALAASQKAGIAVLVVFFALGAVLLKGVRTPGR